MTTGSVAIIGEMNSLFGAGLRAILHDVMQFSKIYEAKSYSEILAHLEKSHSTRLLAVDFAIPEIRDEHSLRQLRLNFPSLYLVVVSDSLSRTDMLHVLAAGAHGYVPTSLPFDQIVEAFKTVLSGQIFVPTQIADIDVEQDEADDTFDAIITAREREVLNLVAQGNSNKMIARVLQMSEGTVKAHVSASYRKLGVNNRVSAAALFDQKFRLN